MYQVSQLIKFIKEAYSTRDTKRLGELLVSLIEQEPLKWMALLYMENIIPRPLSKNFMSGVGILAEAIQTSLQFDQFKVEHFRNMFLPLLSIHTGLNSIVQSLEKLNVWENKGIRTIYRVSAFLEDQYRISQSQMNIEIGERGYLNSENFLNDNIHTLMDDGKSSRSAGYEANCENLQLILAHALQKYQEDFYGDIENCKSVYEDDDFSKLIVLASLWIKYDILWENVIFQGWYPLALRESKDVNIYVPQDKEEFIRSEVGIIRKQEMLYEIAAGSLSPIYSDTSEKIKSLAHSITLPAIGKAWNCEIDIPILRENFLMTLGLIYAEYEIYRYHYDGIAKDIRLGSHNDAITWEIYQKVLQVFRLISKAFNLAVEEKIEEINSSREFFRIIVIEKSKLAEVLQKTLGLESDEANSALNSIIFSPAYKNIEIWDCPLIEIDKERILFVPALIEMGSPARAMENIITQWNPDLFSKRGKILENRLKEFLQEHHINAQGPITFSSSTGSRIECDLVTYWEGYLILVEAKCTKDVFSSVDFFRAKRHIEDAISQLDYRKKQILENWEAFRLAATHLALPESLISPQKIKLIAVTNVLNFTSWKHNDVIVTDEFCFKRFFGDANVEAVLGSNKGHENVGMVGRIRKHVRPTAGEFFVYLENPPQVEAIKKCLTLETIPMPIINEQDAKMGMIYSIYHPEKHPARIATRRLLGKKPKKRKRHHKN